MNSEHSGALNPGKPELGCKANKGSDAGVGDLSVLPALKLSSKAYDKPTKHASSYGVFEKRRACSSRFSG